MGKHFGFKRDPVNNTLDVLVNGTEALTLNSSAPYLTVPSGLTITANGLTVTAGGLTVTAGGATVTAGDIKGTAGNLRLGAISAFGTTEPTSAAVFKQGTEFAGAIATSGGIMSNATVMRKIIADGTVSNIA